MAGARKEAKRTSRRIIASRVGQRVRGPRRLLPAYAARRRSSNGKPDGRPGRPGVYSPARCPPGDGSPAMSQAPAPPTADVLAGWVTDARRRTLELIDDLDDEQLMGPRLGTVNPLLWEVGHLAWFQEKWSLRHPRHERFAAPRRRRAVRLRRRRPRHALGPAAAVARADAPLRGRGPAAGARSPGGRARQRRGLLRDAGRLPRGHARRGVHLHAPDAGLPRAAAGRPAAGSGSGGPLAGRRRRSPAAPSGSGRARASRSSSTTRSGRTPSSCGPSPSPGRR